MSSLEGKVETLPGRLIRTSPLFSEGDPRTDVDLLNMWENKLRPTAQQVKGVLEHHAAIGIGLVWDFIGDVLENGLTTDAKGWQDIAESARSAVKTMIEVHRKELALHFYIEPYERVAEYAEKRARITNAATAGGDVTNLSDMEF